MIQLFVVSGDMTVGLLWQTLRISESIGAPDDMSAELLEINDQVRDYMRSGYLYTRVERDGEILFSGIVTGLRRRVRLGIVTYVLTAVGWEYLLPKRLVGVPDGTSWMMQDADNPDGLPTAVCVDPNAFGYPTAESVRHLFSSYWSWPPIDTTSYVVDVGDMSDGQIDWSGTDMDGALGDMAAAGSAAAIWWFANDAPGEGSVEAPHLALHFGVIVLPDDSGDLSMGMPTVDAPSVLAPYAISDAPDGVTSILPMSIEDETSSGEMVDRGVYVRGATGYTKDILPAPALAVPEGGSMTTGMVLKGPTEVWTVGPDGLLTMEHTTAPAGGSYGVEAAKLHLYAGAQAFTLDQAGAWYPNGGSYWKLTSGPYAGKYVYFWSNERGYGNFTIDTPKPADPGGTPAETDMTQPYTVGEVKVGGTGWVGSPGGLYGEAYVDAPAAVTQQDRDQFGQASMAARSTPSLTVTVKVVGYDGWHKGQSVSITDAALGYDGRFLLIRSVSLEAKDPQGEAIEYTLTVGDTLSPQIGHDLRQRRLKEERKPVDPATKFVPYDGDLLLEAGETALLTRQLANAAGKAMAVKNVLANWFLMVNGGLLADAQDAAGKFYLTDLMIYTDAFGQITAVLHAGATVTAADRAAAVALIA